jgi:hypothetical protein
MERLREDRTFTAAITALPTCTCSSIECPANPPSPPQLPFQWHTPTIAHRSWPQSSHVSSVHARDSLIAVAARGCRRRGSMACVNCRNGRSRVCCRHRIQRLGCGCVCRGCWCSQRLGCVERLGVVRSKAGRSDKGRSKDGRSEGRDRGHCVGRAIWIR